MAQAGSIDDFKEGVRQSAEEQKNSGAERLDALGEAFHGAADKLAKEMPEAATAPIYSAAESLESLARQLREKNIGDLTAAFNEFARKQPVLGFTTCVLAGFALTHFLKSSGGAR